MQKSGHKVRIVSIDIESIFKRRRYGSYTYTIGRIPVASVNYPVGKSLLFIKNFVLRKSAEKGFALITEDGWIPDIIHAHFSMIGYAFSFIAQKHKIRFVVTEHSSQMNKVHISKRHLLRAKIAYQSADTLIAVSRGLADSMCHHTGIKPKIIHNILDTSSFKYKKNPSQNEFVFVSTSNLIQSKHIDLTLLALSNMKNKNCKLIIFGDGTERKFLENLAKTLNVADRVFFKGHTQRSEISKAYEKANCFVLPSLSETFGVAYIEAMAKGLPVIATQCGGPEDFVTEKVGILIPINDEKALTEAMDKMILTSHTYDKEYISQYVIDKFSPPVIAKELNEEYNLLLAKD